MIQINLDGGGLLPTHELPNPEHGDGYPGKALPCLPVGAQQRRHT